MKFLNVAFKKGTFFQVLVFGFIAFVNSSCAKTMQAHKMPENTSKETAQIYIFRPSVTGFPFDVKIYENRSIAGQVGSRGYLAWETPVGEITLEGKAGVTSDRSVVFTKIEAQAGKVYYFKLIPKLGIKSYYTLKEISETEATKLLSKFRAPRINVVS